MALGVRIGYAKARFQIRNVDARFGTGGDPGVRVRRPRVVEIEDLGVC
jgi:hypothetical protein